MDRNFLSRSSIALGSVCLAGLLSLPGCQSSSPPSGPPAAPPVVEVSATEAVSRQIVDYREFTGRTAAVNSVEIRARVSGYLLQSPRLGKVSGSASDTDAPTSEGAVLTSTVSRSKVTVQEGDVVKKGDLLFVIDPEPYELALQASVGSLDAAEARIKQANQDLKRTSTLIERDAISREEYDQSVATVAELNGQIETLRATVNRNKLDVEFTRVRSPIDGLLGSTMVTEGNLVLADSSILTTVVSVEPIYVDFDVDERSVLDYRARMIDGKVEDARQKKIPIRLGLSNEEDFPHAGRIDFVNNVTDPNSGNTRVRGVFENANGFLSPGLFARIRAPFTSEYNAVLIPTIAIGMDQQGRYAMVIDQDATVSRRTIRVGEIVDELTVISEGVQAGEMVVTSGLQKIQPGTTVSIAASGREPSTEASPDTPSAAGTASDTVAGDSSAGDPS